MHRSPDREVRVRALAGVIVLCSWARHFTLTVPLSTQEYKWVPANCQENLTKCLGVTCDGLASHTGGVAILLVAFFFTTKFVVLVIVVSLMSLTFTITYRHHYYNSYNRDRTRDLHEHPCILEKNAVSDLRDAVINQDPKVTGALLDSYVAGYWAKVAKDPVLDNPDLRVGTVLDHQFAYGFVIAGALAASDQTEKCMRKKLNSMETEITSIIQTEAKTMEVNG